MKISEDGRDSFEFSTGTRAYANCHIIGLGPDMEVSGGYDQGFESDKWNGWEDEDGSQGFTVAERIELADYMIEQWTKYKNKAEESKV